MFREFTFPNQLTFLRIILSPVFYFLYISDNISSKRLAIIIFVVASLTDWYDGWHARKFKSISKIGIFLDPLADKILISFAFILFYKLGIMELWMVAVITVRDIVITILRSKKEYNGITLKTSSIAKMKTFLQMIYVFVILLILFVHTYYMDNLNADPLYSFLDSTYNYYLQIIIVILTLATGISYFIENKN